MINYTEEPLVIKMNVPEGEYEVTLSIHADEDTVFAVYTHTGEVISEDREIENGTKLDLTKQIYADKDGIAIYIKCDRGIRATAAVTAL